MMHLLCLLEEPSACEMLTAVLSKILPESVRPQYMIFRGKQDLEKNIERKLRGWKRPDTCFLVMRDQDSGDCMVIKRNLRTKALATDKGQSTIVCIACRELESFYLGDLSAVEQGLKIPNLSSKQRNRKFRDPDGLTNAAQELERLTGKKYQKIQGARDIAPFLKLDESNTSHSFNVLISGIRNLTERMANFAQ
jgi:hypothetical protein